MGILTPGSVSATIGTSGVVFAATDTPTFDPQRPPAHLLPRRARPLARHGCHQRRRPQPAFLPRHLRHWRKLRRPLRRGRQRPRRLRRPALGALPLRRAHPPPRPQRPRRLCRHHRQPHPRPLRPRRPRGRRHEPARHPHPLRRARHPCRRPFGSAAAAPAARSGDRSRPTSTTAPSSLLTAEEGGAFGAALLAGTGIGIWPTVQAACAAAVHVAETIPHRSTPTP